MRDSRVVIIDGHKCKKLVPSENGKIKLGGQKFRYLRKGENAKVSLYKVIEQPKKEEENNDNG